MKRRVYVMDCGDFVKIGVSVHPDKRKNQIPYKVKQYYSSEPVENSFELEKKIHSYLRSKRNKDALGKEYFDISFSEAVETLTKFMNCPKIIFQEQAVDKLKILLFGTDEKNEFEEKLNSRLEKCIFHMSEFDAGYFAGKYCNL